MTYTYYLNDPCIHYLMNDRERRLLFTRASKRDFCELIVSDENERLMKRMMDGAKNFKRKILGLCGINAIITEEELINLLEKTNIAKNEKEARDIAPSLNGLEVPYYRIGGYIFRHIRFQKQMDGDRNFYYKISTFCND